MVPANPHVQQEVILGSIDDHAPQRRLIWSCAEINNTRVLLDLLASFRFLPSFFLVLYEFMMSEKLRDKEQDSLEKGIEEETHVVQAVQCVFLGWPNTTLPDHNHRPGFDVNDLDHVQRRLKQRHVQM